MISSGNASKQPTRDRITRRLSLLIRRHLRGRSFGVCFTGTSRFRIPESLDLCGQTLKLSVPDEVGTAWDFINLALDDEYGLGRLAFRPKTILDIGANFGLFSLLAADRWSDAAIHAYEPNPRVFPHLKANAKFIGATVYQAGVGSRAGYAVMKEIGETRLARTELASSGHIPVVPIGDAIERLGSGVDLLKLDCEGAEWDIFEDASAFRRVRAIRMEYHLLEGRSLNDLRARAESMGFQVDRLTPHGDYGIAWLSRMPETLNDAPFRVGVQTNARR